MREEIIKTKEGELKVTFVYGSKSSHEVAKALVTLYNGMVCNNQLGGRNDFKNTKKT